MVTIPTVIVMRRGPVCSSVSTRQTQRQWRDHLLATHVRCQRILRRDASCPLVPPMLPGVGVRLRAHTLGDLHHDAGVPRYAQARDPQRRGANAGPVGVVRPELISMPARPVLLPPACDTELLEDIVNTPDSAYPENIIRPTVPTISRPRSPSASPTPGDVPVRPTDIPPGVQLHKTLCDCQRTWSGGRDVKKSRQPLT